MNQSKLLENMVKFNNKSKPKTKEGMDKKQNTFDSVNALYEVRELTINAFRSGVFPILPSTLASRPSDFAKQLKILTSKQMLQSLPIALARVKAGNASGKLLNKIREIIYSLCRTKKITEKSI